MDPSFGVPLEDVDDGWAFVYALATLGPRLRAVSLGYGNIDDLEQQAAITADLQGLFPAPRLDVEAGRRAPRSAPSRARPRRPSPPSSPPST